MKVSILLFSLSAVGLAFLGQTTSPLLKAHDRALKDAKSLIVQFTVQPIGGTAEKSVLTMSRPGGFMLETPKSVLFCDGQKLIELDKEKNTYTESPADNAWILARLAKDDTWAWSAFLLEDQFKGLRSADSGMKRMIRGNQVTDLTLTFEGDRSAHIYIDSKLGIARGASVKSSKGEWLILATDIKLGAEPLPAEALAFNPPAGATKVEKPKEDVVSFATVSPILMGNCLPCHSSGNRKGGFDATSYAGVTRRNRWVTPGDPNGSPLVKILTGQMMPRMPQNAPPLPQRDIDTIKKWIEAGAKE